MYTNRKMKTATLIAKALPASQAKAMCKTCAQRGSGFGPVTQFLQARLNSMAPGVVNYIRPQIESYVKKHAEAAMKDVLKKMTGQGLYVAGRPRYYGSGLYVAGYRR